MSEIGDVHSEILHAFYAFKGRATHVCINTEMYHRIKGANNMRQYMMTVEFVPNELCGCTLLISDQVDGIIFMERVEA